MSLSSNSWTYTVPAGEDAVSAMCRVLQVNRSTYYYEEKPGPDEAGLSSETAFAAINAWRDRSRRRQKEISLEYLTEEKFYPLGTTDEYFEAPYEEYPVTICGQTVILTNGELAAALLSLPEKNREIIFLYFFGDYTQQEIGEMYGRCRSTTGYQIRRTLQLLHKEMEVLSHGESELFTL